MSYYEKPVDRHSPCPECGDPLCEGCDEDTELEARRVVATYDTLWGRVEVER